MSSNNPILNSPYDEPLLHYGTNSKGELDYQSVIKGRRIFKPSQGVIPQRQSGQKEVFEWNEDSADYISHIINLCRKEVGIWRDEGYTNTTRVTKELLNFWFVNSERLNIKRLFFAQREAIETAIWLNEVAEHSNPGQHILNLLRNGQKTVSGKQEDQLPRIAFKMATGSGKTVVMAALILYHYFNRLEYRNNTKFADYFLIVAPGITIRDRLGVLKVDTKNKNPNEVQDYYRIRGLVPNNLVPKLDNLNAKLIITNYHSFEAKTLQGNKKSPFDGKVDLEGNKIETDNKEDFSQVVKRTLGKFKQGSRLLILNDEAHHCYLPKSKSKTTDNEEVDENARAAVWFSGIREIAKRFKLHSVYDLSATPYYLTGSGYEAYSLFPWVVSDFGLIEAIEAGLVKIPFIPEMDNTHELEMPKLRNIYDHVKDELPKKGRRKKKSDAKKKGETVSEERPQLPALVNGAIDMFYTHYSEYDSGVRDIVERRPDMFTPPPVFIIVCNNTSVSKEVYKYIAGYEYTDEKDEEHTVSGAKEMFSNFDSYGKPKKKPPTLLIDSDALENGDQVNDEFKKIFASEIEEFKKDYARIHGQGSAELITDAQILREVVNTVGQQGKLGAHIRCVVSVSMLTEGWDANTVTHIMGLRAFGSQLLCEQVAGRALRRMNYYLQGYDKEGNPTTDKRKVVIEKFPPEYAHIIGVPFKLFKGGKSEPPSEPQDIKHIHAMPEREEELEITFPNVVGYRIESVDEEIRHDFSTIENFEIDTTDFPTETILASPISGDEVKLEVKEVLEKRENELLFRITKELIRHHYTDDENNKQFHRFNKLKEIVKVWYREKVELLNETDVNYKKLLFFYNPKSIADHIQRGINTHINTKDYIRPVFNYYNRFGSTKYVNGNTVKEVYATKLSHVNNVVMDSGWEGICAKTLEQLKVISYVKNQFLQFTIPYLKDGKDKLYVPDFITRVKTKDGTIKNLLIEITGFNQDKAEKKWYVENRWLPAVNAMKEKYEYDEWQFIEITDIKNIKTEIIEKISSI